MPSERHPLTIWSNASLTPDQVARLRDAVRPHRLIEARSAEGNNLSAGSSDTGCRSADVAFGQPAVDDVIGSTTLRWIHLTSAGYTRYDRNDVRQALATRGAALTNASAVYADPCAQHLLAMMLAQARQLRPALLDQAERRSWAYPRLRPAARVLAGDRVLLVGFGAIGRRMVELLRPFGVHVLAVRRRARGDEPVPIRTPDDLDALLPDADHIVNTLPSAPGNGHFFDARRFSLCRRGVAFYNVGRGDTVDQDALLDVLRSGQIGAAWLDVTTPEPLPPDHPLWTAPNCAITPHIAGGRQREYDQHVAHFLENLRQYATGAPLVDRVF
jgi:phosphoglycerate dehydrogenase-like enzyme